MPATLVRLTAMLLFSLFATSQFIAASEHGSDGPDNPNSGPKTSGTKDTKSTSKAAYTKAQLVKETVEQARPYLERAGKAWIEQRQCASCHQVPFML